MTSFRMWNHSLFPLEDSLSLFEKCFLSNLEKKKISKLFLGLDSLNFVWNNNYFSPSRWDILKKKNLALGWQDKGLCSTRAPGFTADTSENKRKSTKLMLTLHLSEFYFLTSQNYDEITMNLWKDHKIWKCVSTEAMGFLMKAMVLVIIIHSRTDHINRVIVIYQDDSSSPAMKIVHAYWSVSSHPAVYVSNTC